MQRVRIYTDGSCLVNPGGAGGWAVVLSLPGQDLPRKELSGAEPGTTNNRMEMRAVIEGLKALIQPCQVEVETDSQYVINGFVQDWIRGWVHNNWMRRRHHMLEPVPNADLWQELVEQASRHQVTWTHVRGHNGNPDNEHCDYLAYSAACAYKAGLDSQEEPFDEQPLPIPA